jgi:hypothetical protein
MRRLGRAIVFAFAAVAGAWAVDFAFLYPRARATITSTVSSITALGNGSTTVFNFPFVGVQASDISVIYTDLTGAQTVLNPVSYTLSLNAAPPGQLWGIGGSVTYPLTGPPIAAGTALTIARNIPLTQLTSSNQGQRFALAIEQALDTLAMQIQQVNAIFGRALVVPVSDTCTTLNPLPTATQRANQILGFDSTGCTPIASQPSSALVTAAMQPVVAAPSIAAAQVLLGIGTTITIPVGAEVDWPGLIAPLNWKLEDGSAISRTTYSALLGIIAPVVGCTITMGSSTITGIASTTGWGPGWIIESPGSGALPTGRTIASVSVGSITINGGAAVANATSCQIFPYGTAQDGSFNVPNAAGVVYAGIDTANINLDSTYCSGGPGRLNAACGTKSTTLNTTNLPAYTPSGAIAVTITDPGHTHPVGSGTANVGGQNTVGDTNLFTNNAVLAKTATTGITAGGTFTGTAQGGIAQPFSALQPTSIRNKIIFTGVP